MHHKTEQAREKLTTSAKTRDGVPSFESHPFLCHWKIAMKPDKDIDFTDNFGDNLTNKLTSDVRVCHVSSAFQLGHRSFECGVSGKKPCLLPLHHYIYPSMLSSVPHSVKNGCLGFFKHEDVHRTDLHSDIFSSLVHS